MADPGPPPMPQGGHDSHGRDRFILVFDGACNLCNGFVRFVVKRDKARAFRFAASQSEFGAAALRANGLRPADPASMLLLGQGAPLQKADAALAALAALGGVWRWVGIFRLVPAFARNAAYSLIARNRYRWFGSAPWCDVPGSAIDDRFLK